MQNDRPLFLWWFPRMKTNLIKHCQMFLRLLRLLSADNDDDK